MKYPSLKDILIKYKMKKGLIDTKEFYVEWDYMTDDFNFLCRVDDKNKINMIMQSSFGDNLTEYEDKMLKCLEKIYSNNYKIVIVESYNSGGFINLCYPFSQYLRPKISDFIIASRKYNNFTVKNMFKNDQFLNIETCRPYTEENIKEIITDDYSGGYFHQRTQYYDNNNIYFKKTMEKRRKEFLSKGNTRKPTDIIVFTDGYSFSCASILIKDLQIHGSAIIVGYNSRPGNNTKFDSSLSPSQVKYFEYQENVKKLKNLGFTSSISFEELFDPNDKNSPKIPQEFLIFPIDELSKIHQPYKSGFEEINEIFINESKRIFEKYNENGECNPDNKYLYYETSECDSIIKIDKAHGGYVCGTDGKWNKTNCIASYCDEGYILNLERTKCIKNPCDDIMIKEIVLNAENDTEYIIDPNSLYVFKVENENNSYSFNSDSKNVMHIYNKDEDKIEIINEELLRKNGEEVYINMFLNSTKNFTITVRKIKNNITDDENGGIDDTLDIFHKNKNSFPTWKIILIIIGLIIPLLVITLITFILKSNKAPNNVLNSESKTNINN